MVSKFKLTKLQFYCARFFIIVFVESKDDLAMKNWSLNCESCVFRYYNHFCFSLHIMSRGGQTFFLVCHKKLAGYVTSKFKEDTSIISKCFIFKIYKEKSFEPTIETYIVIDILVMEFQ